MKIKELLVGVFVASVAFTSCSGDSDLKVSKPIEDNILGRWKIEKMMELVDGQWREDPGEVVMAFRDDSSYYHIYPIPATVKMPQGDTEMDITVIDIARWSADNESDKLFVDGVADFKIFRLNNDCLVLGNPSIEEESKADIKYVAKRLADNDKHLIEKMIGKWEYTGSHEKTDGNWNEADLGNPDESVMEFREDGTMSNKLRVGEQEQTNEFEWAMDMTAPQLLYNAEGTGWVTPSPGSSFAIEDDDLLVVYYSTSVNVKTGETQTGEFKDVYKRVK